MVRVEFRIDLSQLEQDRIRLIRAAQEVRGAAREQQANASRVTGFGERITAVLGSVAARLGRLFGG